MTQGNSRSHEAGRPRNAERSRAAILDAAERIFARDGWGAATLAVIGAEAGVSRGTPGYFFGSKEGLRVAMEERLAAAARLAAADTPGNPLDRVLALLARQLELVAHRPALARIAITHWSSPAPVPSAATAFALLERDLLRRLAELLGAVPGASASVDPTGAAAQLLVLAWTAALPNIPGGSVLRGPAAVADRQAMLLAWIRKIWNDSDMRVGHAAGLPADSSSLPASKSRPWRLPGVS
jgi:AcrR family transcriptional regulator